ncbi:SDR family NAD(P)-dependent oxidoreductase [Amycolatopsis sp. NPDC051373]|uniref:SDR family NAD(P)-dependent oxidoreductase n=1 Tax=Amycolatopsis sp. NPDC051373 TaxID=3155801 RepID=UPI00344B8C32
MVAAGHTVYNGARDVTRGREAADQLGAKFLQLDVTDDESVAAAAGRLTELDVLVNCAGAFEGMLEPEDATAGHMRESFDVNVFGVVPTIHAFLPVLRRSDAPVIVNVGSGLGSFETVNKPERHESRFPLPV